MQWWDLHSANSSFQKTDSQTPKGVWIFPVCKHGQHRENHDEHNLSCFTWREILSRLVVWLYLQLWEQWSLCLSKGISICCHTTRKASLLNYFGRRRLHNFVLFKWREGESDRETERQIDKQICVVCEYNKFLIYLSHSFLLRVGDSVISARSAPVIFEHWLNERVPKILRCGQGNSSP